MHNLLLHFTSYAVAAGETPPRAIYLTLQLYRCGQRTTPALLLMPPGAHHAAADATPPSVPPASAEAGPEVPGARAHSGAASLLPAPRVGQTATPEAGALKVPDGAKRMRGGAAARWKSWGLAGQPDRKYAES